MEETLKFISSSLSSGMQICLLHAWGRVILPVIWILLRIRATPSLWHRSLLNWSHLSLLERSRGAFKKENDRTWFLKEYKKYTIYEKLPTQVKIVGVRKWWTEHNKVWKLLKKILDQEEIILRIHLQCSEFSCIN